MTTRVKYRICLAGLSTGGVLLVVNIVQTYTLYLGIQLLPVTITPTGFVVGCVLLFLLAMPTYYYRAQLQAEDMTEHRAAEALAAYASEIKKSR